MGFSDQAGTGRGAWGVWTVSRKHNPCYLSTSKRFYSAGMVTVLGLSKDTHLVLPATVLLHQACIRISSTAQRSYCVVALQLGSVAECVAVLQANRASSLVHGASDQSDDIV